jgi:hypothetical protein
MASGHMNRVKRPDTWLHRPMLQNVKKVLANPEPSTHDPQRGHSACCSAEANFMSFLARRFGAPLLALGIVSKYPLLVAASHAKPHSTASCEPRYVRCNR